MSLTEKQIEENKIKFLKLIAEIDIEGADTNGLVSYLDENGEPICGPFPFTFDGEKVYNFWEDYPDKLTSEEKAIFDEEYPEMAALKNYGKKDN